MRHIIEYSMVYDANTGVINKLGEEETFIQLSNQSSRLLFELLRNAGEVVDRDELIKRVWEEYGYSGSSISLNVALSELRKAFKNLGHDPTLIQTIRRKGLCFTAAVESLPQEKNHDINNAAAPPEKGREKKVTQDKKLMLYTFLILLNIIVAIMYWTTFYQPPVDADPPVDISERLALGTFKKCSLYWVGQRNFDTLPSLKIIAEQEVVKHEINCDDIQADVFYSFFKKMQVHDTFISVCFKSTPEHYKNCQTYRDLAGQ